MKKIFLLIVILGSAVLVITGGNSVYADEKSIPARIISMAKTAKDATDYYSSAKTVVEIAGALGGALGLISKSDPDKALENLHNDLVNLKEGIDWSLTMDFLALAHSEGTSAIHDLIEYKKAVHDGTFDGKSSFAAHFMSDPFTQGPFHRPYNPKTAVPKGDSPDNGYIWYTHDALDPQPGDLVYDWRLGVPALLEMVSWRIQFIAALDPNFRNSGLYDVELNYYRDAIQSHYEKMLNGVRCGKKRTDYVDSGFNGRTRVTYMCADLYSGFTVTSQESPALDPPSATRLFCYGTVYWGWGDCYLSSEQAAKVAELESQVKRAMPLFQMKAMIDTLALYAHRRSQDLTDKYQRIPEYTLSGSPSRSLCLDTVGGSLTAGTNVVLHECNGSPGQNWVYNRKSGLIRNPASGLCLDIGWESAAPGMPVVLWYCTVDDSLKWTYDPITHILQNKLGTVLDIDTTFGQDTTTVSNTWLEPTPRSGSPVQSWPLVYPVTSCAANSDCSSFGVVWYIVNRDRHVYIDKSRPTKWNADQ
jgi:Ricin-type beta-trefoil lectin domain